MICWSSSSLKSEVVIPLNILSELAGVIFYSPQKCINFLIGVDCY